MSAWGKALRAFHLFYRAQVRWYAAAEGCEPAPLATITRLQAAMIRRARAAEAAMRAAGTDTLGEGRAWAVLP